MCLSNLRLTLQNTFTLRQNSLIGPLNSITCSNLWYYRYNNIYQKLWETTVMEDRSLSSSALAPTDLLPAFARAVYAANDLQQVGKVAIKILSEAFQTH